MKKTVHIKYRIDILSGSLTAMIMSGNSILYQFSGACSSSIPVTGQDFNRLLTSALQLAGAGITAAATGSAPSDAARRARPD